ncbi:MAG TPA: indole-3-glycerol phosphate synthase TrpC [Fimbriimonas sp.]|nr:indole-3-glycerol phosphate synthase TrpC [Fimbriimonadaceae bacterium]HWD37395.1 indole-3-glycerol phosphate synthase TrpC [Fimbriimonas sp.]
MNKLTAIFERKREEVQAAKREQPLAMVREAAASAPPPRGFLKALETAVKPLALIAEIKKASPSAGLIRDDFDPGEIANIYEVAGANALSVLTDVDFFQGSPNNLVQARASSSLPCLRKDFLDDPYQIYESRGMGADAILLILAALETAKAKDLMELSWALGMDALVEVHSEAEAERALSMGANLVGVNNRSLSDFKTDLATGERVLPLLKSVTAVAESALKTHDDLQRMQAAGARAVLIGTTFCAAPDIGSKVKEVMGW